MISDDFRSAFGGFGSIVMDCNCGRTHFEDNDHAGTWAEGELEDLRAKAEANPDKYIGSDYSVSGVQVNGRTFVADCQCNGAEPFEVFIWNHRGQIMRYLQDRIAEEKKTRDAEDESIKRVIALSEGA